MQQSVREKENQVETYNQMVFEFIRETDRFIQEVGSRAAIIKSRTDANASEIVNKISESRIASRQIGASLATLNRAVDDATFQNAILGIQRALNEIIWKFSGIRRYCLGLKMKGEALPAKSPLNHMVNQLDGEIFRAVRKITDSLELASERYYGLERRNDEDIALETIQEELGRLEGFEPSHEATLIMLESQKYQIRDVLHMYGIYPEPVARKPRFRTEKAQEGTEQSAAVSRIWEARINRLEDELSRTIVSLQSRLDELGATIRTVKTSGQKQIADLVGEQMEEFLKDDKERREELRNLMVQLSKLRESLQTMDFRVKQSDERVATVAGVPARVEQMEKKGELLSEMIQKVVLSVNEKFTKIESRLNGKNGLDPAVLDQIREELEGLADQAERSSTHLGDLRQIAEDHTSRLNDMQTQLVQSWSLIAELGQKIENQEARIAETPLMVDEKISQNNKKVAEQIHLISKKNVERMIRRFIAYMKGTNGEKDGSDAIKN